MRLGFGILEGNMQCFAIRQIKRKQTFHISVVARLYRVSNEIRLAAEAIQIRLANNAVNPC